MCFPLVLSLWFAEHTSDLFCNTHWPCWNDTSCVLVPGAAAQPAEPERLHVAQQSVLLLDLEEKTPSATFAAPCLQQPASLGALSHKFLFPEG